MQFIGRTILGPLIILVLIQQFFTAVVSTQSLFLDHCPPNSNGCIRVNRSNQYRANNIEMRYPVTFKQSDVVALVHDWILERYAQDVTPQMNGVPGAYNNQYEFVFHQSTWYGMVIDTVIRVQECAQVFKAKTVTMQSQTRLGYKDYGENYLISKDLYSYLDTSIVEDGRKSFISCT